MEWTDIRLTVAKADADNAEAVATMIAEGGIYIEDYSDIEQQVAEIAHVDLIEQELLDKPRDRVIIHMYLEPGASPVETLALISARMEAAGIAYTVETEGVEQEDWQNGWRKYYHPLEIGKRLAVVPSWQEYDTDRVKLVLDPGLAFGTGGHETTSLCMEALDERVQGGERVLDIGTGSGILAIAALKLGAAVAEGVDIANEIAPEHLEVCVDDPFSLLNSIRNAGSIFLGKNVPEALGDYFAGPNHTLPTLGTARFSSPLSVDDFVKKSSFIYYTKEALGAVQERIVDFAEREGLSAHARSVSIRFEDGQ